MERGCIQQEYGHGEGAFCHQAIVLLPVRRCEIAALAEVPGDIGWVLRVRVVGSSLANNADNPHRHEDGIDDCGEDGIPDVQDEHGCFAQQDKGA